MYLDLANSKKVLISGCVLRRKESVKVHKMVPFCSVYFILRPCNARNTHHPSIPDLTCRLASKIQPPRPAQLSIQPRPICQQKFTSNLTLYHLFMPRIRAQPWKD